MFALPTDFMTNIWAGTTSAFSALAPFTAPIIGLLLTVLVLSVIIKMISGR